MEFGLPNKEKNGRNQGDPAVIECYFLNALNIILFLSFEYPLK